MPRTNHAPTSKARKKKIIKQAKGYFGRRKNVWSIAKNAVEKGWEYAYKGRKQRKRQFRSLWIQRINAEVRKYNLNYATFINQLKKQNIQLNRKTLAELATNNKEAFAKLIKKNN